MKDYIQRKVAEFKEIQKESFMTATAKPLLLQPEAVAWYEQVLIETINHAEQEMMKKVGEEIKKGRQSIVDKYDALGSALENNDYWFILKVFDDLLTSLQDINPKE